MARDVTQLPCSGKRNSTVIAPGKGPAEAEGVSCAWVRGAPVFSGLSLAQASNSYNGF